MSFYQDLEDFRPWIDLDSEVDCAEGVYSERLRSGRNLFGPRDVHGVMSELKRFRLSHYLSQSEAARLLGYSQGYLSALERRKKPITPEFITRFNSVFRLDWTKEDFTEIVER